MNIIASLLIAATAFATHTWDFTKGVPSDVVDYGVSSGWKLNERWTPSAAFTFEADLVAGAQPSNGIEHILWDSMAVTYSPKWTKKGLQVAFAQGPANNRWIPKLYFGFGDEVICVTGPTMQVMPGDEVHFKFDFDADGFVVFTIGDRMMSFPVDHDGGLAQNPNSPTVIGNRATSLYWPFNGEIKKIVISERKAPDISILVDGNFSLVRGEKNAKVNIRVRNKSNREITDGKLVVDGVEHKVATMKPGDETSVEMAFDTRYKPGTKNHAVAFTGGGFNVEKSIPVTLGPRVPERMMTLMWGFDGQNVKAVADFGFTHLHSYTCGSYELDEALKYGLRMTYAGQAYDPKDLKDEEKYRCDREGKVIWHDRKGRKSGSLAVSEPAVIETMRKDHEPRAKALGRHVAFTGLLPVSENRDYTRPSFGVESAAFKEKYGYDIPNEIPMTAYTMDFRKSQELFPDGVVPDDDPRLVYWRWFWSGGDGWPEYVSKMADVYKENTKNRGFFSFWDPAVRCPPRWGSGGRCDMLNQWVYANPDPIAVGGSCEEMFAMAKGNPKQDVAIMTQLICYRARMAPSNTVVKPEPEWVKRLPLAGFPVIPPDALTEATWTMMAKPVKAIMYHGWGCIFDTGSETGYCYTNPKSSERLKVILNHVVAPLGPTLLKLGRDESEIAVFESFTSAVFGGGASFGWICPPVNFLQRARLDPRVIYEEEIERDGFGNLKYLYMPQCRFLTPSMIEKIKLFQKRGGKVIGDEQLISAIKPDITVPVIGFRAIPKSDHAEDMDTDSATASETRGSKSTVQRYAENLRKDLSFRQKFDSSSPEIITFARKWRDVDYVFAINDKRDFGDYVGQWGLIMEKGLPFEGEVTYRDAARKVKAVYELSRGRKTEFRREGDKIVIPVKYATNDGRLFAFLDDEIADTTYEVRGKGHGDVIGVRVSITGKSGKPVNAALPVEVRLFDSAGDEIDGGGYICVEGGVGGIVFRTNLDDAPGDYRVVVKNLAER